MVYRNTLLDLFLWRFQKQRIRICLATDKVIAAKGYFKILKSVPSADLSPQRGTDS